MPESVYDKYNGSSSEEEEESDEEVVLPRRTQQFRVAATPAEAKAAVLSDIRSMADQQQANETVVTEIRQNEKTEEEKRALEQRQQMLKQQEQAKAQQAAALQAAASKIAAAGGATQAKGEDYAQQMEEEMRKKAEAARKQAEEERRLAEQRQAQAKAQQEAALKAMQEQVKKAQEEALQKAREAKAKAEAEAKAKAEQARQQAENKAKLEAEQRAKAQAEAQARAAQAKAQAELAAKKSQQEAMERAQKTKLEAEQKAKLQQQQSPMQHMPATKVPGAQAGATSTTTVPPKTATVTPTPMTKQPGMSTPQNIGKAAPTVPAKTVPQVPAKPATQVAGKPTPAGPPTAMKTKPDPTPVQNNQVKPVPRIPGKVTNPMPVEPKQQQQRPTEPISKNTALRQTAKMQEEALAQEPSRPIKGIQANKPSIGLNDVRERFVEKKEAPIAKESVKLGGVLTGASKWEEQAAQRQLAANTMGMDGPVPAAVRLQDDSCWQTQHRVPPEIPPPQIGKISIPEFNDLHEVRRTVIVNKPSYQKVKWNEFPEEVTPEIGSAPKVQTQEWKPINQDNVDVQRSQFQPSKISRVWPPPQEEIVKETEPVRIIKANDDCGWIHQDAGDVVKTTVWQRNSKIDKVWPPPEGDIAVQGYQGPQHMSSVQWPPAESEQHEREQVEVLQKHIPARKIDYQWPPPPPVYQVVNGDVAPTDMASATASDPNTITVPGGGKTATAKTTTTITSTKRVMPNPAQFQQQQTVQVVKAK